MKNILVPTDFSKNAHHAAHFAAALAHFTGARVLLFHAYHLSMVLNHKDLGAIDLDLENFENLNQTQIDSLAYDLHKTYGISVTRIMRPGFAVDEIPVIARRLKADLIVLGAKGAREADNWELGSTTKALLAVAPAPILCIPASLTFTQFAQINATTDYLGTTPPPAVELLNNLVLGLTTPIVAMEDTGAQYFTISRSTPAPAKAETEIIAGELTQPNIIGVDEMPQLVVISAGEATATNILNYEQICRTAAEPLIPLLAIPAKDF